jgi:hypothetical protein
MHTSLSQKRIFHAEQFFPNSYKLYLLLYSTDCHNDVSFDPIRLKSCIDTIVNRHPMLQSSFHHKDGILYATLHPASSNELVVLNSDNHLLTLSTLSSLFEQESFSLSKGPFLFKSYLVKSPTHSDILFIIFHHIIFDGWSSSVFKNELIQLYNKLPLPPLEYTYQDFCVYEQQYLLSSKFQSSLHWWNQQCLSHFTQDLPYKSLIPSSLSSKVYTQIIQDHTIICKWNSWIKHYKMSTLNLFHAVWSLLVLFITGQSKSLIGTVTAGRPNLKTERLIGMFANTILCYYPLSLDQTFQDFIVSCKKFFFQVLGHSHVPYDYISQKSPQVMITSTSSFSSHPSLPMTTIPAKFDLLITADMKQDLSSKDCLHLSWIYREGLFDLHTIQSFATYIEQIITHSESTNMLSHLKEKLNICSNYRNDSNMNGFNDIQTLVN